MQRILGVLSFIPSQVDRWGTNLVEGSMWLCCAVRTVCVYTGVRNIQSVLCTRVSKALREKHIARALTLRARGSRVNTLQLQSVVVGYAS